MAIEKINYKIFREEETVRGILETENISEHLCALAERLFQQENEVGSGNFSRVYRNEKGLVYKKEKPLSNPKNSVKEEAEFLSRVSGFSDKVKTPFPIVAFSAFLKREKDSRIAKQNVLVMEEIKGYSLDKLIPQKPGEQPIYKFPDLFDVDTFFKNLNDFIQKMHNELHIYHRDIADRNIMVEISTGMPVLIDFGEAVEFYPEHAEDGDPDAYGRIIASDSKGDKILRKDIDLERLAMVEESTRRYLTDLKK